MTRQLIRYKNRKIYDKVSSKYVSFVEIAEVIRDGEDVTILDFQTKLDVTSEILTSLLLERESTAKIRPSPDDLMSILRCGDGSLASLLSEGGADA